MKHHEPVSHIMSKDLITVSSNGVFSAVKNALEENNIHHVPILNGNKLTGIVSRVDVLKYTYSKAFNVDERQEDTILDSSINLDDIMTKDIITVNQNDTVKDAAEVLSSNKFNSLPVVNDDNELVGIVTTKDLINYLLEQY